MYTKKYHKYSEKYKYISGGKSPVDILKDNYIEFINSKKNIDYGRKSGLRIATYNVHYFTDTFEKKNTYHQIISNIEKIDADVIILQEALIGGTNVKINAELSIDISKLYSDFRRIGYSKVIFCNTTPSWYDATYGNIMLINDKIKNSNCESDLCVELNEYNFVFPKADSSVTVSGKHEGTRETRCYIYVGVKHNNINYHIYGTHLDVASEETRLYQIKTLVEVAKSHDANDIVIIMGDFNTFSNQDKKKGMNQNLWDTSHTKNNGRVVEYLEENNYYDVELQQSVQNDVSQMEMSTWNNTRVDFIFCNKILHNFRIFKLYSDASDHIPVILQFGDENYMNHDD